VDVTDLLREAPYAQARPEKQPLLLAGLNALTAHHASQCESYRNMIQAVFGGSEPVATLTDVPWLPVRQFKRSLLSSVPPDQIVKTLVSSGTSGQAVSRIVLDAATAQAQTRALVRIASAFLGSTRMPMLVVDDDSFLRDRSKFNARAAGILGFSTLGRQHFYLLDERLQPDWAKLQNWLEKIGDTPVLLFGFTFIVWLSLYQAAERDGVSLRFPPGSMLVHGGGWKKLEEQKISNDLFKAKLKERFGLVQVYNYYGMVEQVGSIFFECEHGHLHTPLYADVIVRDPLTLLPLPAGETGVIQVLSVLPRSYPGHSLLTEDLGTVLGEDDCPCGRKGRYFAVHGRMRNVEVRGCSDTRLVPA
jgi:hypothetical protein